MSIEWFEQCFGESTSMNNNIFSYLSQTHLGYQFHRCVIFQSICTLKFRLNKPQTQFNKLWCSCCVWFCRGINAHPFKRHKRICPRKLIDNGRFHSKFKAVKEISFFLTLLSASNVKIWTLVQSGLRVYGTERKKRSTSLFLQKNQFPENFTGIFHNIIEFYELIWNTVIVSRRNMSELPVGQVFSHSLLSFLTIKSTSSGDTLGIFCKNDIKWHKTTRLFMFKSNLSAAKNIWKIKFGYENIFHQI